MSSCFILLDSNSYYQPGSTVTGKVICTFINAESVKEITVKLTGEEQTNWTEEETFLDDDRKYQKGHVQFSGHHRFLEVQHKLKGEGTLGPGRFELPFFFQLPAKIPGTFQGNHGGVIFLIYSKVNRGQYREYADRKLINVFSPINFNDIKSQLGLKPVAYSDDKTLCCWCCASGSITIEVHLEKQAFVQQEPVEVKVNVANSSSKNIERIDVKLEMDIISKTTNPKHRTKQDSELLASDGDEGVGANGERTYSFKLNVPSSISVPNFGGCTLFQKTSKLKVTAVIPGPHTNLEITIPITMGHIPIYDPSQPNKGNYTPVPPSFPPNPVAKFPDFIPTLYPNIPGGFS